MKTEPSFVNPPDSNTYGTARGLTANPARWVHCTGSVATILKENPMSHNSRLAQSDVNEIPAEISELVAVIQGLPNEWQAQIEPCLARVVESTKRRRRILNLVQDALSQLRVDMKYLVFDLEATRRERDEYQRQLNEATGK